MEIESLEILDYVRKVPPLDQLDQQVVSDLVNSMEIAFVKRGARIIDQTAGDERVYLIRSGAVEIKDTNNQLVAKLAEGEWFGQQHVLTPDADRLRVTALENCLLYLIPANEFSLLVQTHPQVQQYFEQHKPARIRHALKGMQKAEHSSLMALRIADLVHGTPLFIEDSESIATAARLMTQHTVTAMLVNHNGRLAGILTDRAFCTKVVAEGMDSSEPVSRIMTPEPLTLSADSQAASALLLMSQHNIRHLPVMRDDKVVGMVTATDLIRKQSANAIYLVNEIHRAHHLHELVSLSEQLPGMLVSLVESSMTAHDIGHAVSSVGQAITYRLLLLAEEKLGAPPVEYCWVCAGSMARGDQTAHSDQDNALILDNGYIEASHKSYFQQLAKIVCDGLHACGYVYCPGDVMASNPKWCQPLSVWKSYFSDWIDEPEPKALMHASIFFDLKAIYGKKSLLRQLRKFVLQKTRNNHLFLSLMAENALQYQPPLGFFRQFVLEKGGEQGKALDMKKRGVVPIIDLARVYALQAAVEPINTRDRLIAGKKAGVISQEGARDLLDAYEFIGSVRLQHQAKQVLKGDKPDNFVSPNDLSSLERRHLKDAFEVVVTLQSAMRNNFQIKL